MALTVTVHGKPVTLTEATLSATWAWYADNCRACAKAALAGEFFCNDPQGYAARQEEWAGRYDAHEGRMSVAFIQRAVFIQTGECVGLLS